MDMDILVSTTTSTSPDPRLRLMEAFLNILECSVLDPLEFYQVCLNVAGYILAYYYRGDLKIQAEASLETILQCAEKNRELNKSRNSNAKIH